MKRTVGILFAFMLISQTILSGLGISGEFLSEGAERSVFTDVVIVKDPNDTEKVKVNVSWSTAGLNIGDGDTDSTDIPSEVTIASEQEGSLTVKDVEIGTFKVTKDGKVAVTFNEEIIDHPNAEGTFSVDGVVENKEEEETEKKEGSEPEYDQESKTESGQEDQEAKDDETSKSKEFHNKTTRSTPFINIVEIEENIITGVELVQRNRDGSEKILEPGQVIEVTHPYDEFQVAINYKFALPNNHSYGAGSTYTIEIPEMFTIQPNPEPIELMTQDGTVFGSFIVTNNGEILITFNENIEEKSDITGFITAESKFDKHYSGAAEGEKISFPISGGQTIDFPVKFFPSVNGIDKRGVPNKAYNTETITWTVDFNKSLQTIENAALEDLTTGNHTFKDGTLKVYKLHMNANGTIDESKTHEITNHGFGDKFPLQLGDIDSAYRIVYDTEIPSDDKGESYRNKAILKGDDFIPIEAEASVGVKRGQPLEKKSTGYDGKTQTITWEVKYNYDEKVISEDKAKLTDVFGANQEFVQGSFEIYEVDIDPDTGIEVKETAIDASNYTFISTDNGFTFQFHNEIEKAYKMVYKTKATKRVEDGTTIKNKITDEFGNEKEGSRGIGQQIFQKTHNNDLDYKNKTMSWKLIINSDAYTMEGVKVVDKLPKGFTPREITVKHDGVVWENYTSKFHEDTQELMIEFTEPIHKEVIITYTTDIDFDKTENNNSFKNDATLTWDYEGKNNGSGTKTGSSEYYPDDYTKANGFKGATYNLESKVIEWEIGVNYNKATLNNAVMEDYILGNQNFHIESVNVYHMELEGSRNGVKRGEPLTLGDASNENEYEIEKITNAKGEPGFKVKLGDIDTPYLITYETDLNDQLIEKKYDNIATVKSTNHGEFVLKASISPNHGGEYTKKTAEQNKNNPRIVNWNVNINYAQSTVSNVSISDTPSANQLLLPDTIKLYETIVTQDNIRKGDELTEGEDYTLTIVENEDGTETFTITFTKETIDRAYVLEYDTRIMFKDDGNISNDVKFTGEETAGIPTDNSITQKINLSNIGGGIDGSIGNLEILKVDANNKQALAGATFELYDQNGELIRSYVSDGDGKVIFKNLLYGEYIIKESEAPEGYVVGIKDEQSVKIEADNKVVTVENYPIIYEAQLTKVDAEDNSKVLEGAIFELQQKVDGEFKTIRENLTSDEHGVIYVKGLEAGEFQFVETEAPEGYLLNNNPIPLTIDEEAIEIVTVIAKNNAIETTSIEGTKTWKDGDAEDRPEVIKVDLLRDGTVVDTTEVTADTDWKYSFTDLPKTDTLGNAYEYSVKEQPVDGYESIVNGNDITNLRVGKIEISGTKTWKDDNSPERPESITVKLLQNGEEIRSQEVTAKDSWKYSFTELDEFDEGGVAYEYTIEEEAVDGYETTIDGYDITNVRVGKTEVSGTKTWKDENSPERPISITVNLLQNGNKIDSREVTSETEWKYSFTDLEAYDENGVAYEYTIEEETVDGYKTAIDGYDITNVRVGKTEVSGTKTWKDDNPEDRPDFIKINLLQNGVVVDAKEVTKANNWSYSFTDLEKYDDEGVAYEYTIKEQDVPGYASEVDGFDITNTRSEKKSIKVTKGWLDDNSQNRPESINVTLLQNGNIFETVEITKDADWSYTFEEIEAYDENGKAYEYTVEEEKVDGYETTVEGYDITNLRVGKTEVSGTKTWKDDNSKDRPASITVKLLQNGEEIDSQEVTSADDWTYNFIDLDEFDENGIAYDYTVEEEKVEGYETTINGFDITNLRVGTITVDVTKVWKGDHIENRPSAITVDLLQNGEVIETVQITAENGWKYSFTDLEKYDEEGKLYTYTLQEKPVDGYETTINETVEGFEITNTFVEDPTKPMDPEEPKEKTKSGLDGKGLPNTATNIFNIILIGLTLTIIGLFIYRKRKTV